MKEGNALHNILLLSGMFGVIVLAIIFDLVVRSLVARNAQMGGLDTTLVWIFPLLELVWMMAVVGLVWLMISGGGYSRWISIVFLLAGLVLLYFNPVLYVNELPDSLYVIVQYLTPGSMLFQAGGAIAAIGLLSIWFWKEPQVEKKEEHEPEDLEFNESDDKVIND